MAVFLTFLLVNAVILTMTMLAFRQGDLSVLPWGTAGEYAIGLRFLLVLAAAVVSWLLARVLYKQLVTALVSPDDSCSTASSVMSYLVLTLAAVAFLGPAAWLWLPVLFVIVLLWSTATMWSIVGRNAAVASLAVASAAMVATWFLVA
jgi:hypothetical protein